jgi:hypothetical protein
MARRVALAVIVGVGVLVTLLGGWSWLLIYLVLVVLFTAVAYSLGSAGEWLQNTSRRRFDEDERRR